MTFIYFFIVFCNFWHICKKAKLQFFSEVQKYTVKKCNWWRYGLVIYSALAEASEGRMKVRLCLRSFPPYLKGVIVNVILPPQESVAQTGKWTGS